MSLEKYLLEQEDELEEVTEEDIPSREEKTTDYNFEPGFGTFHYPLEGNSSLLMKADFPVDAQVHINNVASSIATISTEKEEVLWLFQPSSPNYASPAVDFVRIEDSHLEDLYRVTYDTYRSDQVVYTNRLRINEPCANSAETFDPPCGFGGQVFGNPGSEDYEFIDVLYVGELEESVEIADEIMRTIEFVGVKE